jgi:hypothetical protein
MPRRSKMKVSIFCCDRCGLAFVADEPPNVCPACLRHHSGPVTIRLAGRDVTVESVRLYGDNPLKDRRITKGLDTLQLGARCPHGFIAPFICSECP